MDPQEWNECAARIKKRVRGRKKEIEKEIQERVEEEIDKKRNEMRDYCNKYQNSGELPPDKRETWTSKAYNSPFNNSEKHHVDTNHVVYIPKELHRSIKHDLITGLNMDKINALAFQFLLSQS